MANKKLLGEILIEAKLTNAVKVEEALNEQKMSKRRVGSILIDKDYVATEDVLKALEGQTGFEGVNLENLVAPKDVIELVSEDVCRKYTVMPFQKSGNTLSVAMADPSDFMAIDDIKFMTNTAVKTFIAPEIVIQQAIDVYYGKEDNMKKLLSTMGVESEEELAAEGKMDLEVLQQLSEGAPVIKMVNTMLINAVKEGVSDIHLEIFEKTIRLRNRIDGALREVTPPPRNMHAAIVSRIKIMAGANIAERRLPQGGKIPIKVEGRDIDIRVSILPTEFGEKIVMRILDKSKIDMEIDKLGFTPEALKKFKSAITRPFGMVLVTGPTGSGKTTTLYSALNHINDVGKNIITAENPIEYSISGINQVQVNEEIGYTFAAALREFLRQDPDIVLVQEIRDHETAEIAIQAALTGHLVFSTLHTNDAPSSLIRLIDMGVFGYLVTSVVHCIQAQRLVRRICENCKKPYTPQDEELEKVHILRKGGGGSGLAEGVQLYHGEGCDVCNGIGYRGRLPVFEVMNVSDRIKEATLKNASPHEIKKIAVEEGMETLSQNSLRRALEGTTTLEECLRVSLEEEFQES